MAVELPPGALVAVGALHRHVGGVAAGLEDAPAPLGIQEVDVVVFHADGFPAVGEMDVASPYRLVAVRAWPSPGAPGANHVQLLQAMALFRSTIVSLRPLELSCGRRHAHQSEGAV
jgi:hypothetical protein